MRCLIGLMTALVLWGCGAGPALAQTKPHNVVLIIADDLGMQVGCFGHKAIKTPNLDKLAKNGVRFTHAHATVSSCSPSRASIFTGLFTHQNGQFGLAHLPHGFTTFPWVQSLPALLRQVGYYTGLIGKFHVAPDAAYPFHELVTKGLNGNRDPVAMAKKARQFITNAKKQPFFLVFASSDPHRTKDGFGNELFPGDPKEVKYDPKDVIVPDFLPDQPEVRKELAEYYQSISRFDRAVGLLLEVLAETGHADDTMIIFLSDNGMPFPGAKTTLYDVGVHLPMILAAPGHQHGHASHALVSYVDIAPTILDWTKAPAPKYKLPGRSLLPILDEENPKGWDVVYGSHQHHEITMYYPMRSITTRQHRLIINLAHEQEYPFASDLWGSLTWQGLLKRQDKVMGKKSVYHFLHRPLEELYDLAKDPHELKNLATDPAHAQVLAGLRAQLVGWQKTTTDPWVILYQQGLKLGKAE